jgi:signal peptidase II
MSDDTNTPAERDAANPPTVATEEPGKTPARVVTTGDWVFLATLAVLTAAADLWSKAWAMGAISRVQTHPPPLCSPPPGMSHYLPQRMATREITLLREFLDFQYAENCGGAFGLLHGASEAVRKPFFLLVTVGAIAFIVFLYRDLERGQKASKWALPLVLGGAIGNLVDRVRLGYVVDFIHAHWHNRHHWPTFNVADIAITVGIGLMLLEYVVGPKPAPKTVSSSPTASTSET